MYIGVLREILIPIQALSLTVYTYGVTACTQIHLLANYAFGKKSHTDTFENG